jgi:hypothetical protein
MDPFTTAAAGVGIGTSLWAWVRDLSSMLPHRDILSAVFDGKGERTHGSDRILVTRIEQEGNDPERVWWFTVVPVDGFHFVPVALVPDAETEYGSLDGPRDGSIWRWTPPYKRGLLYGKKSSDGPEQLQWNFMVPFLVMGYRADALIKAFGPRTGS